LLGVIRFPPPNRHLVTDLVQRFEFYSYHSPEAEGSMINLLFKQKFNI
jgi:hypothetical protein